MPRETTRPTYVRKRREVLIYSLDLLNQIAYLKIDLIVEDSQNNISTPVTPLYEQRFAQNLSIKAKAAKGNFDPRELASYFENNVLRTVYIPYQPLDPNHGNHIREIIDYAGVVYTEYRGETHKSGAENFV